MKNETPACPKHSIDIWMFEAQNSPVVISHAPLPCNSTWWLCFYTIGKFSHWLGIIYNYLMHLVDLESCGCHHHTPLATEHVLSKRLCSGPAQKHYLDVHPPSLPLPLPLPIPLSLSLSLSASLTSLYLPAYLPTYLSIYLAIYLSI